MRGRLAAAPGEPVVGYGHRPVTWPGQPTVAMLDEVAADVPVVLVSGDAHQGWLNTRALDLLGLASSRRVLVEAEWYAAYARIHEIAGDEASPEAYLAHAGARPQRWASSGWSSSSTARALDAWPARWAQGVDLLRIRRGVYPDGLDAVVAAGLRTG